MSTSRPSSKPPEPRKRPCTGVRSLGPSDLHPLLVASWAGSTRSCRLGPALPLLGHPERSAISRARAVGLVGHSTPAACATGMNELPHVELAQVAGATRRSGPLPSRSSTCLPWGLVAEYPDTRNSSPTAYPLKGHRHAARHRSARPHERDRPHPGDLDGHVGRRGWRLGGLDAFAAVAVCAAGRVKLRLLSDIDTAARSTVAR
jgi:hypothetical protein